MSKFRCSVCGREISFTDLAYVKQSTAVCKDCMPKYYVRYLCSLVSRRIRGEEPVACRYCKYYEECTRYIKSVRGDKSE